MREELLRALRRRSPLRRLLRDLARAIDGAGGAAYLVGGYLRDIAERKISGDVDLLVIKAGVNRLDLMGEIYRNLHGVGEPVDIIVATPEDVERYRNSHSLVFAPALKEGIVVYAA